MFSRFAKFCTTHKSNAQFYAVATLWLSGGLYFKKIGDERYICHYASLFKEKHINQFEEAVRIDVLNGNSERYNQLREEFLYEIREQLRLD